MEQQNQNVGIQTGILNAAEHATPTQISQYHLPLMTTTDIARQIGIRKSNLNRFLLKEKVIYRPGGRSYQLSDWLPSHYVVYSNSYRFDGHTRTRTKITWTPLGREFIIRLWNERLRPVEL